MNIDVQGQNFIKAQSRVISNVLFISAMKNGKTLASDKLTNFNNKRLTFVGVTPDRDVVNLLAYLKSKDLITPKSKVVLPKAYSDLSEVYKQFPKQAVFEILCFMDGHVEDLGGKVQEFLFSIMVRKNL